MNSKILKIYGIFLRLLQRVFQLLDGATSNHVVIGSSSGMNYNGNAKALFQYMLNEDTSIRPYFITRNHRLYKEYKPRYGEQLLFAYTIEALRKVVTAKAYIITHGEYDLTPFKIVNTGKPLINVWHGFPIKKLGTDSHALTPTQRDQVLGGFDGLVVMSEEEQKIMSRCYHTPIQNVWVTGYPRNDLMFTKNPEVLDILPYIEGKRVLLYAPTFRDFRKTELFPFKEFEVSQLTSFLEKNNAVLLMRVHKNELKYHKIEENHVIKISDGNTIQEINELLPYMDVLITDYSSVYIDQLLIDKPAIFIPYDLEEFTKDRGFNFEFIEVTPGPKISTFEAFKESIEAYLNDSTLDEPERAKMKTRFHKYHDDQSSKRVYHEIEALLS